MRLLAVTLAGGLWLSVTAVAQAQASAPEQDLERSLRYQVGSVTLGDDLASVAVPSGLRYLPPAEAARLLREGGGVADPDPTLGILYPAEQPVTGPDSWATLIEFAPVGYIADDGGAPLSQVDAAVTVPTAGGAPATIQVDDSDGAQLVGVAIAPAYDPDRHQLLWAEEWAFDGEAVHTVVIHMRMLGRRGFLLLTTFTSMRQRYEVVGRLLPVLGSMHFSWGERYEDYRPGEDPAAGIGLADLLVHADVAALEVAMPAAGLTLGFLMLLGLTLVGTATLFLLALTAVVLAWVLGRRSTPRLTHRPPAPHQLG